MGVSHYTALLIVSILIVSCIRTGYSLTCYNCTDANLEKCKDPFKSAVSITCSGEDQVCVKHKKPPIRLENLGSTVNIPQKITRGCRSKDYCTKVSQFYGHCSICSTNLCNASALATPSILVVVIAALKILSVF